MLAVLACACGGSETLARKTLKKCGVPDWLSIPVYQGKPACYEWCREHQDLGSIDVLTYFLDNNSVYVLIVGYTDDDLIFANIKGGSLKEELDAEVICSKFAKT